LRIEFKRFRYTLDFFWDVLGPDRKVVMKATKKMQDHLGDLNDAVVAVAWLDKARGELPKRKRKAVDTYRDFRLAERQTLRDTFGEAWQAFNRQEVRQALALAVSDL
jgi:CHAD domain-containing protein